MRKAGSGGRNTAGQIAASIGAAAHSLHVQLLPATMSGEIDAVYIYDEFKCVSVCFGPHSPR